MSANDASFGLKYCKTQCHNDFKRAYKIIIILFFKSIIRPTELKLKKYNYLFEIKFFEKNYRYITAKLLFFLGKPFSDDVLLLDYSIRVTSCCFHFWVFWHFLVENGSRLGSRRRQQSADVSRMLNSGQNVQLSFLTLSGAAHCRLLIAAFTGLGSYKRVRETYYYNKQTATISTDLPW